MWRKHQSVYQDHIKYVRNDTLKTSCVKILRYTEHVREIHDLAKYPPPTSMKGESYKAANWKVCDQEFTVSEICVAIKYGLPLFIQYELDSHQEGYHSLAHEKRCDLLSTI